MKEKWGSILQVAGATIGSGMIVIFYAIGSMLILLLPLKLVDYANRFLFIAILLPVYLFYSGKFKILY